MTAQTLPTARAVDGDDSRLLRARLEVVAHSLPMTVWFNPTWAFLTTIPFMVTDAFGDVSGGRIAMVIALHLFNSAVATVLYRTYRRDSSNGRTWLHTLTLFQAYIGMTWGATIWLLWVNGDIANNLFVLMPFVGLLWAYSISRAMHLGVYLGAVLPIVLLGSLRVVTAPETTSHVMGFILPVVFAYTLVLALNAIRQFESMQITRLANDDMALDLRRAHDEAIRKRFEAEAANASKTTFLANMSHELRTPLNAILGFSDIIANERLGGVGTPRYKDYAFDINASGSHLLSIINDILDIAKIESGKMELYPVVLDPRSVIEDSIKVVAGRARERHQTLEVHIDADAPMPYADERAMKQIVINLVGNAIKFTQDGGHIDVLARKSDGGFELCVSDNGPGIAPELLEKIFTPFNQVDNRYNRSAGGTGLGLSLVRGLAELHGGKAWVDSGVGQGTRACVYFPVANVPEKRARASA
ncbi:MAG TPA: HAMP domain-containing sensor histidine kinase [Rhizomicrobium sp.]|nr:HAMP domain-containing sensor histidine kinase [Rhizomicrobium sp.]